MSHILKFAGRNGRKDEKVGVGVEANNGDVPFSLQSCPKRKTKGTPPPPPQKSLHSSLLALQFFP